MTTLTIQSSANYNVGTPYYVTLTLLDNAAPPGDTTAPRIGSITATGNGVTLNWASTPGKTYHVAYKDSLSESTWNHLSGDIAAASTNTSWTDAAGSRFPQRYYLVYVVN